MSGNTCVSAGTPQRRVRHEFMDAALTMLVTAMMSTAVALLVLGLSLLAQRLG
ncbi:MAG TPA: hypothetical protein PKL71_03165 [Marmoricola sp.]|nr:hypothetical protein [Marmoricola sp.]